jgi:hypothetical protein
MWFYTIRIYINLPVLLALNITPLRHWHYINLYLYLTYTQLICTLLLVNYTTSVILPCQDLYKSPSTTSPLV